MSQQPVLMQFDCRAPQFVTQIDRNERSGFFLQFAMQVVCSSLQRMGTATVVAFDAYGPCLDVRFGEEEP